MKRPLIALAIAATALLGLTACTGDPAEPTPSGTVTSSPSASPDETSSLDSTATPIDPESVAESCEVVQANLDEIIGQAESAIGDLSDAQSLQAAAEVLRTSADRLGELSGEITDAQVAAALPGLQEAFTRMSEVFAAVGAGDVARAAELESVPADLLESVTAFQQLCAGS